MDSRINLNTTTWLFTRETGEVHQVVEQYQNTHAALGGAYKVMKRALKDTPQYLIFTEPLSLDVHGTQRKGIAVMSDESELGLFRPDTEIDGQIEPFLIVHGVRRPLSDLDNNI